MADHEYTARPILLMSFHESSVETHFSNQEKTMTQIIAVFLALVLALPIPAQATEPSHENHQNQLAVGLMHGWQETARTVYLTRQIMPLLTRLTQAKRVDALTADEWDALSTGLDAWADEHSRLGNLHKVDVTLALNEARLRHNGTQGNEALALVLVNGSHSILHQTALGFHDVATKMRLARYYGGARFINVVCDWALWGVGLDYMALVFAVDPITAPAAPVIAAVGLGVGIIGLFRC